jgi:hypothetical protein
MAIEVVSALLGFVLTLMVFSYLIRDNPLFRIAIYVFVGVASGYAATVVWHSVLVPRLSQFLTTFDPLRIIPVVLGLSLFAKFSPRISWMGSFAMAILVGVGAAAAIGGALLGTLLPQANATIDQLDVLSAGGGLQMASRFFEGVIILAGTVFTLASFHFSAARRADGTPGRIQILEGVAWVGRIFIAITLGVLFAGVYMSALTALIERLTFVLDFLRQLLGI